MSIDNDFEFKLEKPRDVVIDDRMTTITARVTLSEKILKQNKLPWKVYFTLKNKKEKQKILDLIKNEF